MKIKKIKGKITKVINLSKTAKEVEVTLTEPLDFLAGNFVNVFMDVDGEKVRRAYSISSSQNNQVVITLTIRLSPGGVITPIFWQKDMVGENLELMGPLGLNTVDKMASSKVYLFAFGVGAGVVKSLADYFSKIKKADNLTIIIGSKSEEDILYKEYFSNLSNDSVKVLNVVSRVTEDSNIPRGYIQDYIDGFDFNNSDVYVCGQEKACSDLVEKIKLSNPQICNFYIEGFN